MRLAALAAVAVLSALVAACTNTALPAPTQAVCPTPDPNTLTWDNFGQKFMTDYCTHCHASTLPRTQRNGAPIYHDYNTLIGVLQNPGHIDEYAGAGPAAHNTRMPPERCPTDPGGSINRDCPQPSDTERQNLAVWLACEVNRPH